MFHVKQFAALIGLAIITAGCGASNPVTVTPPPINKDWTITATWSYDFSNYAPCSSTVTKGCINGFTWGYLQGSNHIPLQTAPVTACTGSTNPKPCSATVNALLGIGQVTPYVIANGIDNNGQATSSTDGLGPVDNVVLIAASNVLWNRQ